MKRRGKAAALVLSFALVMSLVCPAFAASGDAQGEPEDDTEIAVLAADPTPVWNEDAGPYSFYIYAVTGDDEDASEGLEKINCTLTSSGDPGPDEKHEMTFSFTLRDGYSLVKVTDSDGKTVSGPDSSGNYTYSFSGMPGSSCILYIVLEPAAVEEPEPEPEPDPVDKSVLEDALDAASELDADQFTEESWSRLEAVISSAEALAGSDSATQEEVDDMVSQLRDAIDSLEYKEDDSPDDEEPGETVEREQLEGAVEAAKALDESLYTEESWASLQSALADAEEVLKDEDATEVEITVAYITLLEAVDALETVSGESSDPGHVDKAVLAALILEADKLEESRYTPESWASLQVVLESARSLLEDVDATQADVDAVVLQLQDALEGLAEADGTGTGTGEPKDGEDKIGREQLEAAIETVKELDESQYTEESWARLQTALSAAEETLEDENATEDEYTAAYIALQQAVDTLKPAGGSQQAPGSGSNPTADPGDNPTADPGDNPTADPGTEQQPSTNETGSPVSVYNDGGTGSSLGSGSSGGSTGSSGGTSSATSPQTDDAAGSLLLWSVLAAAGLAGCAVCLTVGKRISGKGN